MTIYNFLVDDLSIRLDKAISNVVKDVSRTQIQNAIVTNHVYVNDILINNNNKIVKAGDKVELRILPQAVSEHLQPCNIALDIVYEDEDLIIINKQAGLTVHPGNGSHQDTLVNALLYYQKQLSDVGELQRPGIVHRLDKDTSGLMVVAKNNYSHNQIAEQIANRALIRKYKTLIWGVMQPSSGIINCNITRSRVDRTRMTATDLEHGLVAITHYKTEKIMLNGLISLVECELKTGRTHQIRVHMSNSGHSIVGDQVYGHNKRKINHIKNNELQNILNNFSRQALHSYYIELMHPRTNKNLSFLVPFPDDINGLLESINQVCL